MKKYVSFVLAILMVLVLVKPTDVHAASNDYTTWKQYDSAWSSATPWPNASIPTFGGAGCYITSVAILLRHYNVVTEADVNRFNPLICNNRLMEVGAVDSAGDMHPYEIEKAYPGFSYVGTKDYSLENLRSLLNEGYACIVAVNNYGHYVAIRSVSGSEVIMMDPGSAATNLTGKYGTQNAIIYFKAEAQTADEDYLSLCQSHTTLAKVRVKENKGTFCTLPCSGATNEASKGIWDLTKDEYFTIHSYIINTVGNTWYSATASNGQKGYLYSGDVEVVEVLFDAAISDVTYPSSLEQGKAFSIGGTITTSHRLKSVTVSVFAGNDISLPPVLSKTEEIGLQQSYQISSEVDRAITFNTLSPGTYLYVIRVTEMVDDPGKMMCYDRHATLVSTTFTIRGDASSQLSVVKNIKCETIIQLPARVVDLYAAATDTSRLTYFDYGPKVKSNEYALMSDGTIRYKIGVTHQGSVISAWFVQASDMNITKNHTYGAKQYANEHPHYAYQTCACGAVKQSTETTRLDTCTQCNQASALDFWDISIEDYYYEAVKWAVKNEITSGTGGGSFSPNNTCTRAQMVTFLWRTAGSPAPRSSENPFWDVKKSDYYYEAILWAIEQGITSGTSPTTFHPNGIVTRGQAVTFLWRYAGAPFAGGQVFSDVSEHEYYSQAVVWAFEHNITSGNGAGAFSPNSACTRAQVVTFLWRY